MPYEFSSFHHLISSTSIFILFSHLQVSLLSGLALQIFRPKLCMQLWPFLSYDTAQITGGCDQCMSCVAFLNWSVLFTLKNTEGYWFSCRWRINCGCTKHEAHNAYNVPNIHSIPNTNFCVMEKNFICKMWISFAPISAVLSYSLMCTH
jgi:hypothetical protein